MIYVWVVVHREAGVDHQEEGMLVKYERESTHIVLQTLLPLRKLRHYMSIYMCMRKNSYSHT